MNFKVVSALLENEGIVKPNITLINSFLGNIDILNNETILAKNPANQPNIDTMCIYNIVQVFFINLQIFRFCG